MRARSDPSRVGTRMHVKKCYARDSADLLALEARHRVCGGSPVGVTEPDHRHRPMPTDPPSRERVQTVFKNVPFFSLYGLFWPQTAFFFSLRKRIWPKPNQRLRAFGRLLATSQVKQ